MKEETQINNKKLLHFVINGVIMNEIMNDVCRRSYAAEGVTLSGFPKGKRTANGHNFGEAH